MSTRSSAPPDAVLAFATEIDGVLINGVHLFRWNDAGRITDFQATVRPLRSVHLLHQRMGALLDRLKQDQAQQQQQQTRQLHRLSCLALLHHRLAPARHAACLLSAHHALPPWRCAAPC